jgi:hypothetical protein
MTLKEAHDILKQHNKWRRGDENTDMVDPKVLGEAIDMAVNVMSGLLPKIRKRIKRGLEDREIMEYF